MQGVTISWDGDQIRAALHRAAAQGLLIAAEHLLGESSPIVPLDEAVLDRSGVATVDPAQLRSAVSYDTPYAVEQHENPYYRHAPGRTYKYLERPFASERQVMQAIIAAQLRRRMR